MTSIWFASLAWSTVKITLLLGMLFVLLFFMKNRSAGIRSFFLQLGIVIALSLPLLSLFLPSWEVTIPLQTAEVPDSDTVIPFVKTNQPSFIENNLYQNKTEITHNTLVSKQVTTETSNSFFLPMLFALWAIGVGFLLFRLYTSWQNIRKIRNRAKQFSEKKSLLEFPQILKKSGIRKPVSLLSCKEINSPMTLGIFRPVIFLPFEASTWPKERLESVLLHELAHIQRQDCLYQFLSRLLCAFYWFHPFVWIVLRRLKLEREKASDDMVLSLGIQPSSYANHLLSVLRQIQMPVPYKDIAISALEEPSELETRFRNLLDPTRSRKLFSQNFERFLALSSFILIFPVACMNPVTNTPSTPIETNEKTAAKSVDSAPVIQENSSIQPLIQEIVTEEFVQLWQEFTPDAAGILVLDPLTGEIVAKIGKEKDSFSDKVLFRHEYSPASVSKIFLTASALEEGVLIQNDTIFCENGKYAYQNEIVKDVKSFGTLTVAEILATSSNIGAFKIYELLGQERFYRGLSRFHFAKPISAKDIESAAGFIPKQENLSTIKEIYLSLGHGWTTTPIQLVAAFASLANGGVYHTPTLQKQEPNTPKQGERLVSQSTAKTTLSLLESVVVDPKGTGQRAAVSGYRVAGKTGTNSKEKKDAYIASFIGTLPLEKPEFVIFVLVDFPKNGKFTGGQVAAPVFQRVASRIMKAKGTLAIQ